MSPEENIELKKTILFEYHQVQHELASLEVQAKTIGEHISQFAKLMQKSPEKYIYRADQEQHGFPGVERVPDAIHQAMKQWEKSFEVADRLRELRWRLEELSNRKTMLGL